MKTFDLAKLKPTSGRITANIFENKHVGIPKSLFFNIEIDLAEFTVDTETINTAISLGFITFDVKSLKDFESRVFEFPVNPEPGYIDGSIYMFQAHNPFDVTKIQFGKISGKRIEARITYSIMFEFESTGYANTSEQEMAVVLEFVELTIDADILKPIPKNADAAKKLLAQFCDPKDFGPPNMEGKINFEMRL